MRRIFILLALNAVGVVSSADKCSSGVSMMQQKATLSVQEIQAGKTSGALQTPPEEEEEEEEPEIFAPEEDPSLKDEHCGSSLQCEADEFIKFAKERVETFKEEQRALKKMKGEDPALVDIGDASIDSRIVPIHFITTDVNKSECQISGLSNMIDYSSQVKAADSPQAGNVLSAVAPGLAAGGAAYGAIGGVLAIGAPTIAAAAGPVGIIALGAGLSIASTLLPLFGGGPEPVTEDTIRKVAGEMMKANNEKVLDLVEDQVNQVSRCLGLKIERDIQELKQDSRVDEMLTKTRTTEREYGGLKDVSGNDIGAYNSAASQIKNNCLRIDDFTSRMNRNDQSTINMFAKMVPIAKRWYDLCYANAWSWMAAHYKVELAGHTGNLWEVGTILNYGKSVMEYFTQFFVTGVAKIGNVPNKDYILAYAHTARSNSRLFGYLKAHSDYKLAYPSIQRMYLNGGWIWWKQSDEFFCRTCGFTQWNKLGRRKEECTGLSEWDYYQFCSGGGRGRWGRLVEVDTKWCERSCSYKYYATSTNWYGRQVNSASALPQMSEGGGNRAAHWKGDEWGYYSYVCGQSRINMGSWHTQAYGLARCDAQGGVSYPTGFKNSAA